MCLSPSILCNLVIYKLRIRELINIESYKLENLKWTNILVGYYQFFIFYILRISIIALTWDSSDCFDSPPIYHLWIIIEEWEKEVRLTLTASMPSVFTYPSEWYMKYSFTLLVNYITGIPIVIIFKGYLETIQVVCVGCA